MDCIGLQPKHSLSIMYSGLISQGGQEATQSSPPDAWPSLLWKWSTFSHPYTHKDQNLGAGGGDDASRNVSLEQQQPRSCGTLETNTVFPSLRIVTHQWAVEWKLTRKMYETEPHSQVCQHPSALGKATHRLCPDLTYVKLNKCSKRD